MMLASFLPSTLLILLMAVGDNRHHQVHGFSVSVAGNQRAAARSSRSLALGVHDHNNNNNSHNNIDNTHRAEDMDMSRRNVLLTPVTSAVASTLLGTTTWWSSFPQPVSAVSGLNKVNAKLQGYGLEQVKSVSNNFIPLLEIYGKGRNRFPLLVLFAHPFDWVVTLPSNNVNGEDGTIQAGEYAKGDTATLYVYTDPGHVNNLSQQPKELFEKAIIKAISQKGNNVYQNFKITKLQPSSNNNNNDDYVLVDFKYELLTGAGFEVDRVGVASITSQGNAVEVLWAASTRQRYKKTEPILRDIVSSFRCWADGINLSEELVQVAATV